MVEALERGRPLFSADVSPAATADVEDRCACARLLLASALDRLALISGLIRDLLLLPPLALSTHISVLLRFSSKLMTTVTKSMPMMI